MNREKAAVIADRERTLCTLQALDENVCIMEYFADYDLPGMLAAEATSVLGTARFLQRCLHAPGLIPDLRGRRGGCSTFNTLTPDGQVIMGRNFDFKNAKCLAVWTHPLGGYRSLAMVNQNLLAYADLRRARRPMRALAAPYASMDGINEKGLCTTILELITKPVQQHTGKPPITTNVALRAILDTCATTEEAVQLLERYDMYHMLNACYHFHFTDAEGSSAIVEYVDGRMFVYRNPRGESLKLTNFFLTPSGHCKEKGRDRYERMECALRETPVMTEQQAMEVLKECRVWFRSKYKVFMIGTLWSAVYNCTEKTMLLSAGMDYSRQYRLSVFKPLEVIRVE